ncbi:MAG: adenylylsulfate kinase, partial [Paraglaciecola sp.]
MATNIVWHQHDVDKTRRAQAKSQKPCVLWL